MGHYYNDSFGYGFLILQEDNDVTEDFLDSSAGSQFEVEMVGNLVIGDDLGVFFKVIDVKVTVELGSAIEYNEYVTQFTDFEVNGLDPELEKWLQNAAENTGFVGKLGAFKVSNFG